MFSGKFSVMFYQPKVTFPPPRPIKQQYAGLTCTGSQEMTVKFSELKYCYYKNLPLPEMSDCHSLSLSPLAPGFPDLPGLDQVPFPGYPDCPHHRTALTRSWEGTVCVWFTVVS